MSGVIKLEDLERMIDNLRGLSIKKQAGKLKNILMEIYGKGPYLAEAVGKILIDRIKRGDIDLKELLKRHAWVCSFSPMEYVLRDESVSASIRATEPKLLTDCDNIRKSIIARLRIFIPTDIEPPSLDKVISVPVSKRYGDGKYKYFDAKIVEIGECQLEITEASVTKFYNKLEYYKHDPILKEVLHYSLPSLFPTESPIDSISDVNPLKSKMAHWEQLKVLNDNSMNIISRRAKLVELSNIIDSVDILELLRLSYDMIKPSQVIKFEFIGHDKFGYYELYDCNIKRRKVIADRYISQLIEANDDDGECLVEDSPVLHQLRVVNGVEVLRSEMPDLYSLPQISAINSWITHGLLSTFLMRREFLQSICTNPFIGNEDFWGYVQHMMQSQYSLLYSASKPLEADTILYRGSPHFKEDPVRMRTVIATSKIPEVANFFSFSSSLGKKIIVPAGTHALDLSIINVKEKEVLIFPSDDSNLLIEPVELLRNNKKRNTYRIRNVNKAGGGKRRRRKTCRK